MYKSIWAPAVGETLACEVEFGNINDPSAVAVHKPGVGESSFETIGHVPRKISALYHFFIRRADISFHNHLNDYTLPCATLKLDKNTQNDLLSLCS